MSNDNRWGIIYCPKNKLSGSNKRWKRLEWLLHEAEVSYDFIQSESSSGVSRLVNMLINNGYTTIIIVGGDSALNDAVNCLMQAETEKRDSVSLGIIPNGLMNDFAHYWGLSDNDDKQTIDWLKKRRVRRIDVGCMRYTNQKGEACRRYFVNCVNIGLVAAIMNLRRVTKRYVGSRTLSFCLSAILMLFQRMEYNMHIKINSSVVKRNVMTVCVGNSLGYGQTPSAVPYNGTLDISVVYNSKILQFMEGLYLFMRGKILNYRSIHPFRTKKVEVISSDGALVGIDGRLMNTPAGSYTITVEHEVLNFIIPE